MNDDIDKLEELPKQEHLHKSRRDNWGKDYPWKKVKRFLISRAGIDWNSITSEFLTLKWIPPEYRNIHQLEKSVEIYTFISIESKIYYYSDSVNNTKPNCIDDCCYEIFYVHPLTKILYFKEKEKINYKKQNLEKEAQYFINLGNYVQLFKINGIWYKIQANKEKCQKIGFSENRKLLGQCEDRYINNISIFDYPKLRKTQLNKKELIKYNLKNN